MLFSEKYHGEDSRWVSSSWTGMFIFELCKKSNSIILETTPIRCHYLVNALDNIRDEGEYTIWAICTYEEGPDWLEIYDNRLKENYYAYCLYFYDEINIQLKKLDYSTEVALKKDFKKLGEKTFQYKKKGRYFSHNEINNDREKEQKNNLQKKCSLADRDKYILNNCYKATPQSSGSEVTNWYSDPVAWNFMTRFEKGEFKNSVQSVEFRYCGKLIRFYDKGKYDECYILDNWFNLDKEIFKNWRKEFQLKK